MHDWDSNLRSSDPQLGLPTLLQKIMNNSNYVLNYNLLCLFQTLLSASDNKISFLRGRDIHIVVHIPITVVILIKI